MEYIKLTQQTGGGHSLKHYIQQTIWGVEWKLPLSVLGTLVASIEGFYGGVIWIFLTIFSLDFISGLLKSAHKGVPITSRGFRDSVTKLGAYMVLITSLLIASSLEPALKPIVTITYYYFIFTELKSIKENVEEMGIELPTVIGRKIDATLGKIKEERKNGKKTKHH